MINLLPSQEKKILLLEQNKRITIILGILILVFLLCFSFFLFLTKIYISGLVKSQEAVFGEESKKLKEFGVEEFQKRISLINENLSKLKFFYQNKVYLTEVLGEFSKAIPTGVYLTNFSFLEKEKPAPVKASVDKKAGEGEDEEQVVIEREVSIYGFAPSREVLFKFKEALDKNKMFKDIYFPASNWVKSENIDFYIRLKI